MIPGSTNLSLFSLLRVRRGAAATVGGLFLHAGLSMLIRGDLIASRSLTIIYSPNLSPNSIDDPVFCSLLLSGDGPS